jgi:hypothetical protein
MELKSNKYVIYPLIPFGNPEDGAFNISDEILVAIWEMIEAENKVEDLFYDGSIRDAAGWLHYLKSPGTHPIIVWNTEEKKVVHVAWLKDTFDCCGWLHHCSIGPFRRSAWRTALEFYQKLDGMQLLLGLTPKVNEKAVRVLKLMGWTIVGEVPWVCNMAYQDKRVSGIFSYFQLHKEKQPEIIVVAEDKPVAKPKHKPRKRNRRKPQWAEAAAVQ